MVSNVTPSWQIYLMVGRALYSLLCGILHCRRYGIHTCVFVYTMLLAESYPRTNDGVELPDGTPRGVRDLYPNLPRTPDCPGPPHGPSNSPRGVASLLQPRCFAKHLYFLFLVNIKHPSSIPQSEIR